MNIRIPGKIAARSGALIDFKLTRYATAGVNECKTKNPETRNKSNLFFPVANLPVANADARETQIARLLELRRRTFCELSRARRRRRP